MGRVDTDTESLYLVDGSETGNNTLDPILKEIADDPVQRNAQYWIERLAPMAEHIIDRTLDRLVALKILEHHDGDFWTFSPYATRPGAGEELRDGNTTEFVKTRLNRVIFNNEIPEPRDVIIICLIDTCDVFRFMFQMDEAAEERIRFICQMDLIGRSIAGGGVATPGGAVGAALGADTAHTEGFAAGRGSPPPRCRGQRAGPVRLPGGEVRAGV